MNKCNQTRRSELLQKKRDHELKVIELNNWLMKNHSHPDRNKVWSDKAYYECEINQINRKLENIRLGLPENGYSIDMPTNNIDSQTINKIKNI